MNKNFLLFIAFSMLVTLCQAQIYPREDTLYIPETPVIPTIDGTIGEKWDLAAWHPAMVSPTGSFSLHAPTSDPLILCE